MTSDRNQRDDEHQKRIAVVCKDERGKNEKVNKGKKTKQKMTKLTDETSCEKMNKSNGRNEIHGQVDGFNGTAISKKTSKNNSNGQQSDQWEEKMAENDWVQWVDSFVRTTKTIVGGSGRIVEYRIPIVKTNGRTGGNLPTSGWIGIDVPGKNGRYGHFDGCTQVQEKCIHTYFHTVYNFIDDVVLTVLEERDAKENHINYSIRENPLEKNAFFRLPWEITYQL